MLQVALLKKINDEWQPAENRNLQIGETIDFPGDYQNLVKTGMAMLVDEDGTELPLPMTYQCSICYNDVFGLMEFVEHVLGHAPQRKEAAKAIIDKMEKIEEEKDKEESTTKNEEISNKLVEEKAWKDMSPEEQKAKRIANLAKAREARKGKVA